MATTFTSNMCVLWPSTNATIPTGWAEVAASADRCLRGASAGANGGGTGGASTHTHTSPSHSHTLASHTHTNGTISNSTSSNIATSGTSGIAQRYHSHTGGTSSAVTGSTSSTAATTDAKSNEPPIRRTILITPSSTSTDIPVGCLVFQNSLTVPTGWTKDDSFMLYYAKTATLGGNAGSTTTPALHSHVITSGHTIASNNHTHTKATGSPNLTLTVTPTGGASYSYSTTTHTHTITFGTITGTVTNDTSSPNNTSGIYPVSRDTVCIKNTGASANTPEGIMVLWIGTLASIPAGWQICDGTNGTLDMRDSFIRTIQTDASLGVSFGSNTHGHAVTASHTHAQSHTHACSTNTNTGVVTYYNASATTYGSPAHTHTVATSSADATATGATTLSLNDATALPLYYTVIFIEKLPSVVAGNQGFII